MMMLLVVLRGRGFPECVPCQAVIPGIFKDVLEFFWTILDPVAMHFPCYKSLEAARGMPQERGCM